jgi:RimJ/RimL family protein N-acetyltransferase
MINVTHTDIYHLGEYAAHLKSLHSDDKYSRFGYSATDYNIDSLILSMIYHPDDHELWIATVDGVSVGWGHMARYGDKWELAVSVSREYQRRGYGNSLINEMLDWAKFTEIHEVWMNCIEDNRAIQHLATKNNLKPIYRGDGERTSAIEVPEPTLFETNAHNLKEGAEIVAEIATLRQRLANLWNPFVQKS